MQITSCILFLFAAALLAQNGQAASYPGCKVYADIAFVVDASGSNVEGTDWNDMLKFIQNVIKKLQIGKDASQVSVLTYGSEGKLRIKLNDYSRSDKLIAAVSKLDYNPGSTNTAEGLRSMRKQVFNKANGDRQDASNVAIVLTDGRTNQNLQQTLPEAKLARQADITIFSVGVGDNPNNEELDNIANRPSSKYVMSGAALNTYVDKLKRGLEAFCK